LPWQPLLLKTSFITLVVICPLASAGFGLSGFGSCGIVKQDDGSDVRQSLRFWLLPDVKTTVDLPALQPMVISLLLEILLTIQVVGKASPVLTEKHGPA